MVDLADVQRLLKTIDKDQSCGPGRRAPLACFKAAPSTTDAVSDAVWDKVEELTRRAELYHDFLAQLASKQQLQDWLHHKSSGGNPTHSTTAWHLATTKSLSLPQLQGVRKICRI